MKQVKWLLCYSIREGKRGGARGSAVDAVERAVRPGLISHLDYAVRLPLSSVWHAIGSMVYWQIGRPK